MAANRWGVVTGGASARLIWGLQSPPPFFFKYVKWLPRLVTTVLDTKKNYNYKRAVFIKIATIHFTYENSGDHICVCKVVTNLYYFNTIACRLLIFDCTCQSQKCGR